MPRDLYTHILVDTLRFARAVKFYLRQLIKKTDEQLQIDVSTFLALVCVVAQVCVCVTSILSFTHLHVLKFGLGQLNVNQ